MRVHLRTLGLLAFITAATALGSQFAAADTTAPKPRSEVKCAEKQHDRHRHHRGEFLKRIAKELGMTEQQKGQAKAILESNRTQNKGLFQEMMTQRRQLRSMIMSGTADEAAIRAQSAKVASVQADLAVKRSQEAKQLLALLTPDQVSKLKTIMEKREQKFRKHFSEKDAPVM